MCCLPSTFSALPRDQKSVAFLDSLGIEAAPPAAATALALTRTGSARDAAAGATAAEGSAGGGERKANDAEGAAAAAGGSPARASAGPAGAASPTMADTPISAEGLAKIAKLKRSCEEKDLRIARVSAALSIIFISSLSFFPRCSLIPLAAKCWSSPSFPQLNEKIAEAMAELDKASRHDSSASVGLGAAASGPAAAAAASGAAAGASGDTSSVGGKGKLKGGRK